MYVQDDSLRQGCGLDFGREDPLAGKTHALTLRGSVEQGLVLFVCLTPYPWGILSVSDYRYGSDNVPLVNELCYCNDFFTFVRTREGFNTVTLLLK